MQEPLNTSAVVCKVVCGVCHAPPDRDVHACPNLVTGMGARNLRLWPDFSATRLRKVLHRICNAKVKVSPSTDAQITTPEQRTCHLQALAAAHSTFWRHTLVSGAAPNLDCCTANRHIGPITMCWPPAAFMVARQQREPAASSADHAHGLLQPAMTSPPQRLIAGDCAHQLWDQILSDPECAITGPLPSRPCANPTADGAVRTAEDATLCHITLEQRICTHFHATVAVHECHRAGSMCSTCAVRTAASTTMTAADRDLQLTDIRRHLLRSAGRED